MRDYQAMIFDLDDTLLNRDKAVEKMFLMILDKCYEEVNHSRKKEMLQKFKEYDQRRYGQSDKINVLESLFDEFSPKYRMPRHDIQDFWNQHFPYCFSINQNTINIINIIKKHVKVAIVTNGATQRQRAKINNTNLNSCFDTVIISEEVGFSKPDKRIFELVLNKLKVEPDATLFVGDDIERDIDGCQNVNIKGIWFNPCMINNESDIKPYDEIHSLDELLSYIM
ncbi:HAD family hydrolase [Bacillus spongiae]|uniref:HAD family hydrolase n=1 Tax=Bacillus spongiae TaxID=2683610 RepID=A0ABU8HF88_9BACI